MNKFTLNSSAKSKKMPSGCWEYRGTIEKRGYGVLEVDRRQWRAHRYMYVQTHGPVSDDLYICHKCDNRLCVNPDHLYAGTVRNNADDAIARDRIKGEFNGRAKLTNEQVVEIRERYANGEYQEKLAAAYNVGQTTISEIVIGKKWVHVGGPRKVSR